MHGRTPTEIAEWIERHAWVRALALSLVADANAADDLVQETWLAALERGPANETGLRGWLATVMRNLARQRWRTARRRDARERSVARDETVADPSQVFERFESYELVAAAVRELDETHRRVILLRYFDGLTPRQIATTLRVPHDTVQTQLRRALERLRAKLDRRTGDRATWIASVAPLAQLAKSSRGALAWSWTVKTQTKIALGVIALLLLSLVAYFALRSAIDERTDRASDAALAAKPVGADEELAKSNPANERASLSAPGESNAIVAPAVFALRGIVVDVGDRALADVKVAARASESSSSVSAATSDADGHFLFANGPASGVIEVADERFSTLLRPRFDAASRGLEQVLVIAPRRSIRGRVVDEKGEPIAEAGVVLQPPSDLRARLNRVLYTSESAKFETTTNGAGEFELADAVGMPDSTLIAARDGFDAGYRSLAEFDPANAIVVLKRSKHAVVHGVVLDAIGNAVENALVRLVELDAPDIAIDPRAQDLAEAHGNSAWREAVRTNRRGEFWLPLFGPKHPAHVELIAVAIDRLPAELDRECDDCSDAAGWPDPLVLRLGGAARSIAGRVLRADGTPASGARVRTYDSTAFGRIITGSIAFPHRSDSDVESIIAGGVDKSEAVADSEGRFRINGLLPRAYRLRAFDIERLASSLSDPITAGATDAEIRLDADETHELVAGRVTGVNGIGIANAKVTFCVDVPMVRAESSQLGSSGNADALSVRTDAQGHFEARNISKKLNCISVDPPDERWVSTYTFTWADLREIHIVLGRVCYLRFEFDDRSLGYQDIVTIDDQRLLLPMRVSSQPQSRWSHMCQLSGTRSEIVGVSELATRLMVRGYHGNLELPLHLEPGTLNVVHP